MNTFKFYLASYGCQMNEYDSNMIAYMLEERGCAEAQGPEDADFVIVNTCSVRKTAEDHAYGRVKNLAHFKKKHPKMKIAIVGCMAKNHGEDILKELPFVDLILGPDNYAGLDKLLFEGLKETDCLEYIREQQKIKEQEDSELAKVDGFVKKKKKRVKKKKTKPIILTDFNKEENYLGYNARIQNNYSALVTIQRGCNKRCAYCIVPYVRGIEKFRATPDIIREVESVVAQGVKEITLLGQTVNSYKFDSVSFAELLVMVADVDGVERVRYTSPHPRYYSQDVLDVMMSHPKIMPHAHIPLQSGSDKILKKMRRQYNSQQFLEIVEQLRSYNPLFGITTDIITGFVGEEEEDFEETLRVVKAAQFDTAFMFSYSPREGTEAFSEIETLSEDQKQKRLARLIDVQNEITLNRANLMLGQKEEIMIDGPSYKNPKQFIGKTESYKKIVLANEKVYTPGDIVKVIVKEVKGRTLVGQEL